MAVEAANITSERVKSTNRFLDDGGNEEDESGSEGDGKPSSPSPPPPPASSTNGVKAQDPNDPVHDKDNHQPILFNRKQLVLFAGPHNSASTSVEEFMSQWAEGGWKQGHPHTKA